MFLADLQAAERSKILAYLALAAGIFFIGTSAIFVKVANIDGTAAAFYRMAIASLVLIPWWLVSKRGKLPKRDVLLLVMLGGAFFAVDLSLWNTGILMTTAAKATLMANNAPLWVGIGTLLFFREKLAPKFWAGLFIALIGMMVVIGIDAWQQAQWNMGDLLSVAASFMYAGYMLITQKARKHIDTLSFNAIAIGTSAFLLLLINLVTDSTLSGYSTETWGALIGMGLLSQLAGWFCINFALGHLRAAHVSVSLLGQPVVTAILGVTVLGEALASNHLLGGLLILMGISLVNYKKRNSENTVHSLK